LLGRWMGGRLGAGWLWDWRKRWIWDLTAQGGRSTWSRDRD
jgi:hypothetical protein